VVIRSVAYQFDQKGVIRLKADDLETATLDAIEAGADDVDTEEGELVIYTRPNQLNAVQTKMTEMGYAPDSAELAYIARQNIMIEDEKVAGQLLRLMDALEEMDDVTATHSNFDFSDELAESLQ
jgi:transcriptional/translational regulatory protein YebC/TACO1